jgi:hypothetical protein
MEIKKRKNLLLVSGMLLTILFTGCSAKNHNRNKVIEEGQMINGTSDVKVSKTNKTLEEAMIEVQSGNNVAIVYNSDDRNINIGIDKKPTQISFEDTNIFLSDNSIGKITDSTLTIQKPGTYVISGTLKNGQIIVNSEVEGIVHLIFDGVSITSKNSAPLYIKNSTKTVLTLNKDTNNYLIDSDVYEFANVTEEEPDGTLFSKSNLTINGSGNLTVTANFRDGISCSKELKIIGSNIIVKAKEDGIKGKDYVAIESGTISVVAGGVGLMASNNEEPSLGYAVIDGGTINIKSINKGIRAGNIIKINNGNVTIKTRGVGLNALSNIYIYNGHVGITSGRNGIQGDKSINILGGEIKITTSDNASSSYGKGITAVEDINILGGDTVIESLEEPILSNQLVYIYDGTIHIQSGNNVVEEESLTTNTEDTFVLNGGYLIAVGEQGMAVVPSENASRQNSVIVTYKKIQKANTLLYIEDEEGNVIVSLEPTKDYQSLVVSSNLLKVGATYNLFSGESLVKSFEITSMATQVFLD